MDRTVILLTACVRPSNMVYTKLTDPGIRLQQYIEATHYYYKYTQHSIVLCNNTGDEFAHCFSFDNDRFEYLFFDGNTHPTSLGKGYGEFEIIKYALSHSKLIRNADTIIKITGRLIIPNIDNVIRYTRRKTKISENYVLTRFQRYNPIAYSECITAPKSFFHYFTSLNNTINDSEHYYFEHLLYDSLHNGDFNFFTYLKPLIYKGVSGTSNIEYKHDYTQKMNQLMDIYHFLYHINRDVNIPYKLITSIRERVHFEIRLRKKIRKSVLRLPFANEEEKW